MPTIKLLNLTMSRDTNGVVTVRVDYTLRFSLAEVAASISFAERVELVRRFGETDRYVVDVPGAPATVTLAPGDRADRVIAVLADATVSIDALGLLPGAPVGAVDVARTFNRVLTPAELTLLLQVGREQPYAVVSASPIDITSDVQLAPVEIDVGDPVAGIAFDVGGEPVGLAVDGTYLYVATKEGVVAKLDRNGSRIASLPIGTELSAIGFDGGDLWVTSPFGNAFKLDRDVTGFQTFLTANVRAVAIAFSTLAVWIVHYGTTNAGISTIAMLDREGVLLGTIPVRNAPSSIAMTPEEAPLVVLSGTGLVVAFSSDGTPVREYPVGSNPWGIAFANGFAWVTSPTSNSVSVINVGDGTIGSFDVGSGPKGIDIGAGAVWIASSSSNELVKVRAEDRAIMATYAVGEGPDTVKFDGDRVFVANRASHNVSLIRVL